MTTQDPSEVHPHESRLGVPDRLPPAEVRELSRLDPRRAILAIAVEWSAIIAAIAVCEAAFHPALYVAAVAFLGARQHALTVIGHDASHHRLLPGKLANDLVGNLCCFWPTFAGVAPFRRFHGEHHRYTNVEGDGNRVLWRTHDSRGQLQPLWVYPKRALGLVWVLVSRVLFMFGPRWILRGFMAGFVVPDSPLFRSLRFLFFAAVIAVITVADVWREFLLYWLIPFCTWHIMIQYTRLICEHSAVRSPSPDYRATRTTIPGVFGRVFVLPRNIGYHLAHHWYPSVPFYRLPELHARLMREPGFRANADVQTSLLASLRECIR